MKVDVTVTLPIVKGELPCLPDCHIQVVEVEEARYKELAQEFRAFLYNFVPSGFVTELRKQL